ncbi:MAG TPA: CNNM domain-containing protein, partial [Acidimicrobiales bacterium]|nr:CNNM domain-containing protein [Acidimicrobiales bacterium]
MRALPALIPGSIVAASATAADAWMGAAIALLLLVTMLLAGAETALVRMPKTRAQGLAADGRKGAGALVDLVDDGQYVNAVLLVLLGCQ